MKVVRTINVRRGQDEQPTTSGTLTDSRQQGRKKVRENHSQPGLYVLQCLVLGPPSAVDLEARLEIGDDSEEIRQGSDNSVKVEVDVVGSNVHRQLL